MCECSGERVIISGCGDVLVWFHSLLCLTGNHILPLYSLWSSLKQHTKVLTLLAPAGIYSTGPQDCWYCTQTFISTLAFWSGLRAFTLDVTTWNMCSFCLWILGQVHIFLWSFTWQIWVSFSVFLLTLCRPRCFMFKNSTKGNNVENWMHIKWEVFLPKYVLVLAERGYSVQA